MDDRLVRISKFLAKYLRHEPEALGLTLEPGGWVKIQDLLAGAAERGMSITHSQLEEVVAKNDKKRFSIDGDRVRANQGHSTEVDLQLTPQTPPEFLYHGTATKNLPIIHREGLKKMSRHHVHLSRDRTTALKVGSRYGKPTIIVVDAELMHGHGYLFYVSENGVWLTDHVPPRYFTDDKRYSIGTELHNAIKKSSQELNANIEKGANG